MIGRRSLLLAGVALPASVAAHAQCVTNAPAVDACLGGVSGPGNPSLYLNFLSATLDPSITWTRSSTATDGLYTDATGSAFNSLAANAPRINTSAGLLVENARTNNLLNSGAPATQTTASLATGVYCLWVIGAGSATASAGTAVGTGFGAAVAGTPNVFTITTAGTVTVTVSGSLTRFQLENSPAPTSYIPTTAAPAIRAIDSGTVAIGAWFNAAEGTLVVDFLQRQINTTTDLPGLTTDANNNIGLRIVNTTLTLFSFVASANSGQLLVSGAISANVVQRAGFTYTTASKAGSVCLNGGSVTSFVYGNLPAITQLKFGSVRTIAQDGVDLRIRYWPRALAASDLQGVTGP